MSAEFARFGKLNRSDREISQKYPVSGIKCYRLLDRPQIQPLDAMVEFDSPATSLLGLSELSFMARETSENVAITLIHGLGEVDSNTNKKRIVFSGSLFIDRADQTVTGYLHTADGSYTLLPGGYSVGINEMDDSSVEWVTPERAANLSEKVQGILHIIQMTMEGDLTSLEEVANVAAA